MVTIPQTTQDIFGEEISIPLDEKELDEIKGKHSVENEQLKAEEDRTFTEAVHALKLPRKAVMELGGGKRGASRKKKSKKGLKEFKFMEKIDLSGFQYRVRPRIFTLSFIGIQQSCFEGIS